LTKAQVKIIKTNKSVQRGIKKKETAKQGAKPKMSLISVILYYTWRSQRYAIYLSKSGRRMEKQYQVVQELQIEGKKRG